MFNCKIYHNDDVILLNKDFKTLNEISIELGLTYQQVADFSSRKQKKNYQKFKYFPKIEINRIQKEI